MSKQATVCTPVLRACARIDIRCVARWVTTVTEREREFICQLHNIDNRPTYVKGLRFYDSACSYLQKKIHIRCKVAEFMINLAHVSMLSSSGVIV